MTDSAQQRAPKPKAAQAKAAQAEAAQPKAARGEAAQAEAKHAEAPPAGAEQAAAGQAAPEQAAPEQAAPEAAGAHHGDGEAKPDLDEVKRKFREALERKRQVHAEGQGKGGQDTGKIHGAHGPAASRRSFRRKSG
jgi:uncharacterized protein DUF5302